MVPESDVVSTGRRCPKCRSRTFDVTETTEALMTWNVTDGQFNRRMGFTEFGGFVGRLSAHCIPCGHIWTMRADQIDDIVGGQP
jgi:hypothetical protein